MTRQNPARALRRDALAPAFEAAGLGYRQLGGPIAPSAENTPIFQLDVHETARSGEYIRLWPGADDNEVEVTGWDRSWRQVVLRVREARRPFLRRVFRSGWRPDEAQVARIEAEGGSIVAFERNHFVARYFTPDEERRYLCGRDEQRLFVAQLPTGEAIESVEAAHAALVPALARRVEACWPGSVVRQGEWFFVPPSPADTRKLALALAGDPHAVRPRRSVCPGGEARPHVADEVVSLRRSRRTGAPAEAVRFARGEVRHVDHFPLWLPDFRRVVLNRAVVAVREEARRLRWID